MSETSGISRIFSWGLYRSSRDGPSGAPRGAHILVQKGSPRHPVGLIPVQKGPSRASRGAKTGPEGPSGAPRGAIPVQKGPSGVPVGLIPVQKGPSGPPRGAYTGQEGTFRGTLWPEGTLLGTPWGLYRSRRDPLGHPVELIPVQKGLSGALRGASTGSERTLRGAGESRRGSASSGPAQKGRIEPERESEHDP
jgi:hypothetical protein